MVMIHKAHEALTFQGNDEEYVCPPVPIVVGGEDPLGKCIEFGGALNPWVKGDIAHLPVPLTHLPHQNCLIEMGHLLFLCAADDNLDTTGESRAVFGEKFDEITYHVFWQKEDGGFTTGIRSDGATLSGGLCFGRGDGGAWEYFLGNRYFLHNLDGDPVPYDGNDFPVELESYITAGALGILGFLRLLSVKGVELQTTHHSERVNRKRRRKGKTPFVDYSEVIVNVGEQKAPATSILSSSAKGTADVKAHAVRGHLKHYTKERPLFGHFTGDVWCPSHVRGNPEMGEVRRTRIEVKS